MMDAASETCGGGARGLLRGRGDIAYPPNAADGRLPGSGRCRVEVNADGHVADDGPMGSEHSRVLLEPQLSITLRFKEDVESQIECKDGWNKSEISELFKPCFSFGDSDPLTK